MRMIERVAKALEDVTDKGFATWEEAARAAIEAMREPTDEMVSEMQDTIRFISDGWFPADGVNVVWSDGIDAALAP